jgi:hypothetical protein
MKEMASTARRRDGTTEMPEGAMAAWVGCGVLLLLIVASVAYVAFGGTIAFEASPLPEAATSMAAVAAEPVDAGGAVRQEIVSARSGTERQ